MKLTTLASLQTACLHEKCVMDPVDFQNKTCADSYACQHGGASQVNNKLATYECHKSVESQLQFNRDNLTDADTARIPLPPNKYIVFFKMTKERGKSTYCVFILPGFCGAAQGQPVYSQSKAELERLKASNVLIVTIKKKACPCSPNCFTTFRHATFVFFTAARGFILKTLSGSHEALSFH